MVVLSYGGEKGSLLSFDLPSRELLQEQAGWLAGARARLLRRAGVAHRRSILDLGCGYGVVRGELARRGGGTVTGLDHHARALRGVPNGVCGRAEQLPFRAGAFDLVFCQLALMWMPLEATVAEIERVTRPGGVVAAIEPDYGGMLEWPEGAGLKGVWIAALERAGADPLVGRKLPGALARAGFDVWVEITPGVRQPRQGRFGLLRGLPLTPDEQRRLIEWEGRSGAGFSPWEPLVYLPFVMVVGSRSAG